MFTHHKIIQVSKTLNRWLIVDALDIIHPGGGGIMIIKIINLNKYWILQDNLNFSLLKKEFVLIIRNSF